MRIINANTHHVVILSVAKDRLGCMEMHFGDIPPLQGLDYLYYATQGFALGSGYLALSGLGRRSPFSPFPASIAS